MQCKEAEVEPFVEVDPTGRYGRYGELLGSGSTKKVYRAFDQQEAREVAWNQVCLRRFIEDKDVISRLYNEVNLLETLHHDNVVSLFSHWTDYDRMNLNFVTEVCTPGNLREYRRKHRCVSIQAMKNWSRQILRGLRYLHVHEPCIIHRDLNCSNVFINGNTGEVKIGDLGMAAAVARGGGAMSVLGTPEFMAPEIYGGEMYTEVVDVYSFGMCLLEMVTGEIPYMECDSVVKIYKVTCGVKPCALTKVKDLEVKGFIEKCLVKQSERPSVFELLNDPFFDELDGDDDDGQNYCGYT